MFAWTSVKGSGARTKRRSIKKTPELTSGDGCRYVKSKNILFVRRSKAKRSMARSRRGGGEEGDVNYRLSLWAMVST